MLPCPGLFCDIWNATVINPLINALILLYDVLLRDFGWAIVVLTVALRFLLYPLFVTQLKSQRAMQELSPALAELKKKHKDDRQKFAEEQMRLYRERGVNPASGCLPVLLQFPILIGLYSALSQVGCGLGNFPPTCPGLTHDQLAQVLYPFVPNPIPPGADRLDTFSAWLPWITGGLAHPEPIVDVVLFGLTFPLPLKILAVLAGASQFVASMMTLPKKQPQTDDPMQRSMQWMVYYFPVITVAFAWSFPAGLALYWVVTTLFSIGQQYYVSGWGKLGAFLPLLEERLPSPAVHGPRPAENPSPQNPTTAASQREEQQPRRRRKRRR